MSNSQGPAPEGQPVHSAKIRIRGVQTGGSAYDALVDRFRGELNQFQGKHQQAVKISGNPQYAAKRRIDGATLWYHNNNGQETVTVIVDEVPEGEAPPSPTPDKYWDWAVVELVIPKLAPKTSAEMSAQLQSEVAGKLVYARYDGPGSDDAILRYAGAAWDRQIGDANTPDDIVSSLLVDLRKFQNDGGVAIDLYGFLFPYDGFGLPTDTSWPYTITGSARFAHWGRDASPYTAPYDIARVGRSYGTLAVLSDFSSDYDALIASFPELSSAPYALRGASVNDGSWTMQTQWNTVAHPTSWWGDIYPDPPDEDPNNYTSQFAATYSDTYTYWDDASLYIKTETRSGVGGTLQDGSTPTSNVIPAVDGGVDLRLYDYVDYFIPDVHVMPVTDARIRVTFFKGGSPDATSYWFSSGAGATYYLWEVSKLYPARPRLNELPDTALFTSMDPPGDASLDNHWGAPKLGTMHINPNMADGGFKFKRA